MKLKPILPYALFLILACIFLWRPIFKGEALLPGDYLAQMAPWNSVVKTSNPAPQWNPLQWDAIAQFYPWRVFYARSMRSGHLPLWNPHQFSGTPFLANGQSAVLYPPNLLFLIFGPITAFTIFAALHLFLAQVFMYWMMRGLGCKELGGIVGAICFAFSAFMVLWLELPTFISAAVWLPLILLLIHRSVEKQSVLQGMLAGGALALAFLAGHLQIAFYVAFASILWWAWNMADVWRSQGVAVAFRRVAVPCMAFLAVADLIAAAQLLPSMELGANSHRVREVTSAGYEQFVGNAVKPYRLVTAFAPDFYGNPNKNTYFLLGMLDGHAGSAADYMEYGLYIGILPLILAVIGLGTLRKRRYVGFFGVLSAIALFVATGTVINMAFYYLIPGFSAFGGPNRILVLYFFGVAGLAGFGIDYMLQLSCETVKLCGENRRLNQVLLFFSWLILMALFAFTMNNAKSFSRGIGAQWMDSVDALTIAHGLLIAGFLFCLVFLSERISSKSFSVIALVLIVADLFAFGINYNPTCTRDKVYPRTALTDTLKRVAGESRIAPINTSWSLFETPKAILPPNAAMVYGLYDVQGYDSLYLKDYKELMIDVVGVDPCPPENGNMLFMKCFPGDTFRSRLFSRYVVTAEDLSKWNAKQLYPDVLTRVASINGITIYELNLPRPQYGAIRWISPNTMRSRGNNPEVGTLWVLPDHYTSGWTAFNGGKSLRTEPWKDHLSAKINALGEVVFSYEPFSFRLGLFLTLLGIASLSFAGVHRAVKAGRSGE